MHSRLPAWSWSRNEAGQGYGRIVLDQMNRADLDRCSGELYPILSGSVARVAPAGLPGVGLSEVSARFRVVATVNDTIVNDIVFPISEGLARRFQRLELPGASQIELFEFLYVDPSAPKDERSAALGRGLTWRRLDVHRCRLDYSGFDCGVLARRLKIRRNELTQAQEIRAKRS